jgi:hypothetical protein
MRESATTQVASLNLHTTVNAPVPAALAAPQPVTNFFTRLQSGDETLTRLSIDQAEAFIRANHTNAESLLAAYQVTREKEYIRRAAELFPNDPNVLIRAIAFDASPENKRSMLEQLKKVDPQNAIASYLSASDHFDRNEPAAALKDLSEASSRKQFSDYMIEQSLTMEEIYLAAGHTPAEAKALGMASLELPHLHEIVNVGRKLQGLIDQYSQGVDAASVSALAQSGLALANRLSSPEQGGSMRIDEFIGAKMQQGFLKNLDPNQEYPFLNGSVSANMNAATQRENAMQADNEIVSTWLEGAPEQEIIAYYDRIKVYGESAALNWLKMRIGRN